ncbi:MAG: antibiotic biosynthesis monooxygenase [Chloroflexota bacterium]
MSETLTIVIKSAIKPGKAAELKDILNEVIAHCKVTEPGMLQYDWYINEDESECMVIEQYASSDDLLFHFGNYVDWRPKMDACREMREVNLLGSPSEKLKELLSRANPNIYGNFIRLE